MNEVNRRNQRMLLIINCEQEDHPNRDTIVYHHRFSYHVCLECAHKFRENKNNPN